MGDASRAHVIDHLQLAERRVRAVVAARRAVDPEPDDPVRGLYVSEDQVDELLAGPPSLAGPPLSQERAAIEARADVLEEAGHRLRLRDLGRSFALDAVDLDVLLVAILPDVDHRFERLYGYLHDDITRRHASTGLALELLGHSGLDHDARRRLGPDGPLVVGGLVRLEQVERPWLTRRLRVPDRVVAHLLGSDDVDAVLAGSVIEVPVLPIPTADTVARALDHERPLVHVHEDGRTLGLATAVAGTTLARREAFVIDPSGLGPDPVRRALREAGLRGAVLVLGPVDDVAAASPTALACLDQTTVPAIIVGRGGWDPRWCRRVPTVVEASPPSRATRASMWDGLEAGPGVDGSVVDLAEATAHVRLRPEHAARVLRSALAQARADGGALARRHLEEGVRQQNTGELDRLARRVVPRADFDDLVLPAPQLGLLGEIIERARHRLRVLDEWRMGGRSGTGRGVTALFAGDSGTGKTLSAEVVAGALGVDLYVIDLATVVDKYIGETEKNLDRIFERAEGLNVVLFFDEADAIFGKRSDVSDARDRYANLEIAFLLQRMERFDGITVLATNLRANLDEAFTRRIDVLVDFPTPDEEMRRRLWELHLPPSLPRSGDLDVDALATAFELAGGDIRNVTLAAAYAAAATDRELTGDDLARAVAREYRKLGRLVSRSEFGDHYDRAVAGAASPGR